MRCERRLAVVQAQRRLRVVTTRAAHGRLIAHTDASAPLAFVRSGEFTPYANVILHAGVAY